MLRIILVGLLVLSAIMLLIGQGMYSVSITKYYVDESFSMTKSAASMVTKVTNVEKLSDQVMDIYRSLPKEEREKRGTVEYQRHFSEILNSQDYRVLNKVMEKFSESSAINDVYIACYDKETKVIVYVCDPEDNPGSVCPPGFWENVPDKELATFLGWDGKGKLYDIGASEFSGWMCTSGVPIKDKNGNTICFILADVTLREVIDGMKSFLLQYGIALAIVGLIVGYIFRRRVNRTVIDPINQITNAANQYVNDRNQGISETEHFSKLEIHTGDEMESLCHVLGNMENALADYERNLTKITAERERIRTELDLATRIQEDMLPGTFPPFPDRGEFDIYASMWPAKEVGGDFYDFYLIDEDHLGLVIADVSGKGIPAALFMMASKIIIGDSAMMKISPAQILERANNLICLSNREQMFVTVWMGILEISTGKVTAASAGHEFPVIKNKDGDFELFKDRHGLVIGAMENMKYVDYEIAMEPGSKIFVYTDGVPEATNKDNEMFGTERMIDALNIDPKASPIDLLFLVKQSVDSFVGEAEAFDDLTMLCVEYHGKKTDDI